MRTKDRQIWKFGFEVTDDFSLEMPDGAQILHVESQSLMPCMWVEVDPSAPRVTRNFHVYGTGHHMHSEPQWYLGTFMLHGGALVFHLYEVM
jgi:hypothetical protein